MQATAQLSFTEIYPTVTCSTNADSTSIGYMTICSIATGYTPGSICWQKTKHTIGKTDYITHVISNIQS